MISVLFFFHLFSLLLKDSFLRIRIKIRSHSFLAVLHL